MATGLPAGLVLAVAASAAIPVDTIPCDGAPKVRADYAALFDRIGTTWGAGDGTTTFNVPDYRDRALYGQGGRISLGPGGTDGVAFGSRGGPNHHHDIGTQTTASGGTHSHGFSVSLSGGGHEHNYNRRDTLSIQQGTQGGFAGVSGNTDIGTGTSGGGGHSHSGSGSTDQEPAHTHTFNGITGGGFGLTPSFAGVIYVITTGIT